MMLMTLFERVDSLGVVAVATALGVDKSGVSRVCSGERRVSTELQDACQRTWGAYHDTHGTHVESRRRHDAWKRSA